MASPLVCLFVTFGESHSRMLIDWATGEQNDGNGVVVVNEQGRELSVRLLRIILAVSSVPAQFPIEVNSRIIISSNSLLYYKITSFYTCFRVRTTDNKLLYCFFRRQ